MLHACMPHGCLHGALACMLHASCMHGVCWSACLHTAFVAKKKITFNQFYYYGKKYKIIKTMIFCYVIDQMRLSIIKHNEMYAKR